MKIRPTCEYTTIIVWTFETKKERLKVKTGRVLLAVLGTEWEVVPGETPAEARARLVHEAALSKAAADSTPE